MEEIMVSLERRWTLRHRSTWETTYVFFLFFLVIRMVYEVTRLIKI